MQRGGSRSSSKLQEEPEAAQQQQPRDSPAKMEQASGSAAKAAAAGGHSKGRGPRTRGCRGAGPKCEARRERRRAERRHLQAPIEGRVTVALDNNNRPVFDPTKPVSKSNPHPEYDSEAERVFREGIIARGNALYALSGSQ